MLIRFRVKNFLSFSEDRDGKPIEFSMIANNDDDNRNAHFKGNLNVLKFAAVYGANAAGKSNLTRQGVFEEGYYQVKEYCAALHNIGIPEEEILGVLSDTVR